MRFLRTSTAILVTAAAFIAPTSASALALEDVGSFDSPTYVTSDPDDADRLFVVERSGRIQLTEGGSTTTFLDIESIVQTPDEPGGGGEQGLFSIAFSPNYANNNRFYVAYSGVDNPSTSENELGDFHLDEFTAAGDSANAGSRRRVLTIEHEHPWHYGGQLQFGPDEYLYASTGDNARGFRAQSVRSRLGKILRLDPAGSSPGAYSVPADNPFTDSAGCTDGCDEIWSYGLRNPWRFSFDRRTGSLVIGDVGELTWEEVDFETGPQPGRRDNFGWNCREGLHPGPNEAWELCANRLGTFTDPVFEYPHVDGGPCAITGGYVVRDRALPDLRGRYLYADFCVGELRSLELTRRGARNDRSEGLSIPRVTSFGQDAACRIYVASLLGPVYRLTDPAASRRGCQRG